jgi:cytidylate kinase
MVISIVAIVGFDRAGKTTVGRQISCELQLPYLELGDCVRLRQESDFSLSRDSSLAFAQLSDQYNGEIIAQWISALAQEQIVVSGFRELRSWQALSSGYRKFLVSVQSSYKVRAARPVRKKERQVSLRERDAMHTSWGVHEIMDTADISVVNEGSIAMLAQLVTTTVVPKAKGFLLYET